ncbi:Uncharacterized protein HZ326_6308 [Fusarium oxysporum f. sp. albedinis]|nr:Uncharacterized protein HZ326_6308 [Fusarium oxysporum f. sp. albedinis]
MIDFTNLLQIPVWLLDIGQLTWSKVTKSPVAVAAIQGFRTVPPPRLGSVPAIINMSPSKSIASRSTQTCSTTGCCMRSE